MADFVAQFGTNSTDETFSKLESLALNKLGYSDLSTQKQDGCRLLLMEGHSQLQFYNGKSGWIVVNGIIYDSESNVKHTVRPDGACCQWRKIPPRELSIDLVADERIGWVTGRAGAS
jgi:hypothetical protein